MDPEDPEFGGAGERLVERHLRGLGWRFLARRLRTRWGELDLVFVEHETLVVLEVKSGRIGPRFRPGMRFGREALARRLAAARGLAHGRPARVDLVEVLLEMRPDGQRSIRLEHHRALQDPL